MKPRSVIELESVHLIQFKEHMKKLIYIICFLAFGIGIGFLTVWYDRHYDIFLYINMPGQMLGLVVENFWVQFDSTINRPPQAYIVVSALFWGLLGTVLAYLFKPKVIAWIAGIYLLIFGGFTLLVSWL
jgi:hypothetical protein